MTITADYQIEIGGSLLVGSGTNYKVLWDGFSIHATPVRTTSTARPPLLPGEVAGAESLGPREIVLPIVMAKGSTNGTADYAQELKAAWQKATTADTYLDVRIPGQPETTLRYYGRPRGLSSEQHAAGDRWLTVVATFVATDPYAYGSAVDVSADSSSPIPIVNGGDANTSRCTLTVVGSGGTPVLTNPSDPNAGSITFASALSGTAVIDLNAQTVTVSSVSREDLVDPSSPWFQIAPGTNNVTFTGCTSVASSTRPAYH